MLPNMVTSTSDLVDVINDLEMGDYPGLSRWALSVDAEEHLTTEER